MGSEISHCRQDVADWLSPSGHVTDWLSPSGHVADRPSLSSHQAGSKHVTKFKMADCGCNVETVKALVKKGKTVADIPPGRQRPVVPLEVLKPVDQRALPTEMLVRDLGLTTDIAHDGAANKNYQRTYFTRFRLQAMRWPGAGSE